MFKRKVDNPIADFRLAKLQQHHDRLAASRGAVATEVKRRTETRRCLFVEGDVNDADANARMDAAVFAVQSASASASVDDALAEVERQLADVQLRLDPERDQVARAAEGIRRERDAVQLKQRTDEFVAAAARLVEALAQVTVVSLTAGKAAAIAVTAVSEIVDATKVINGDLERYVHLVASSSAPIRRQSVTLVKMPAPTPTTLSILPPPPEALSGTNSASNSFMPAQIRRSKPSLALASAVELAINRCQNGSGDTGRYSRSFGLLASVALPPCGE